MDRQKITEKSKSQNGHETGNEGTSRGDTTTNLRNFSSRFFLVRTGNLENANLEAPARKHDKYQVRKPSWPFWKVRKSWKSVGTGFILDFSDWESSFLNFQGAAKPMEPLATPQKSHEKI